MDHHKQFLKAKIDEVAWLVDSLIQPGQMLIGQSRYKFNIGR